MSSDAYKFDIVNGQVTAAYELDDGVWELEPIDDDGDTIWHAAAIQINRVGGRGRTGDRTRSGARLAGPVADPAVGAEPKGRQQSKCCQI